MRAARTAKSRCSSVSVKRSAYKSKERIAHEADSRSDAAAQHKLSEAVSVLVINYKQLLRRPNKHSGGCCRQAIWGLMWK